MLLALWATMAAVPANAQVVELTPSTSPSAIQANLTDAAVTATRGVPPAATAAQLLARITPKNPLDGPALDAPITSVLALGSRRTLRFRVPAFVVQRPVPAYVDIVNASGAPTVTTAIRAQTVILPPPALESVWPPSAERGATVEVTVKGSYTTFPANVASMVLNFGSGITATPKLCAGIASSTQVCATLTVTGAAPTGARTVSVTYGGVTASLANAFVVTSSAPRQLTVVAGNQLVQGETRDITFRLSGASLTNASMFVWNFGEQVLGPANGLAISASGETATLRLTANRLAAAGPRNVMLLVNGDLYTASNLLNISQAPASISSVVVNSLAQGASESLLITGINTAFAQNLTSVNLGPGITVGSVDVQSPTAAIAQIAVAANAAIGPRTVVVTTLGDVPSPGSLTVLAGTPKVCGVTPAFLAQGASANVNLQLCFVTPAAPLTVSIPNGVNTGTPTIAANTVTVPVTVPPTTVPGTRTGTVTFGGQNYPFQFAVVPNAATLVSLCREPGCVTPAKGYLGETITLRLIGALTNFAQGTSQVLIESPLAVLNATRVSVISPAELLADFQLAGLASGLRPVRVVTGGQVVQGQIEIFAAPPALTILPASGAQGATVPVTFSIDNGGTLPAACPAFSLGVGQPVGFTCQNYVLASPTQATATLVIDPLAQLGGRATLPVSGATGYFGVTAGLATLVSIAPATGAAGTIVNVTLTGAQTNWCQSGCATPTSLSLQSSFNGVSIPVTILTVINATQATATLSLPTGLTPGGYHVTVATGGQVVTLLNGFQVSNAPVPVPALTTVSPASATQGQGLDMVLTYANLAAPITAGTPLTANFGPGITTVGTQFLSANSFRASLSVDPLAAIGVRTLSTTVNGVALNGSFSVARGPAAIQSLTPNSARQGQSNVQVILTGNNGTHFAQGTTVADFGAGITVNSLTIDSANSATARITLAYGTSLGERTFRLTTGNELADSVGVFTVLERQPILLSATPARARQGETLDVTVLGEATSFSPATVPDFGTGITATLLSTPALERAIVRVVVSPITAADGSVCTRFIRMTTGSEIATLANPFCVDPGSAAISAVSPNNGQQGGNVNITVTGLNTNFAAGVSTVSFGAGITVGAVNVLSPTSLTAQLAIAPGATTGLRSVRVITLGEDANGTNLFTVGAATPLLTQANPASLPQGATATQVTLTGQFTNWQAGVSTVTFGAGVTVDSFTVDTPDSARAMVTISPTASTGGRTLTVTTAGQIVSANVFSVSTGPASLLSVSPANAQQGDSNVQLTVTGSLTNFQAGVTSVALFIPSTTFFVSPASVVVNGATSLLVTFNIPASQTPGAYTLAVATNGENVSRPSALTIAAGTPTLVSVNPSSAVAGSTLSVILTGSFTTFGPATTANFGSGILVNSLTVNNPNSVTANITIAPAALGTRSISVTTGAETVTGSFTVTPLTLAPTAILRGQTANIVVTAQGTAWSQGNTAVAFGGAGIIVNSVTVNSATQLTASVTIDSAAALGDRGVTVTTGAQVLSGASLNIAPGLLNVSPNSGQRGQTFTVTINGGPLTRFVQGQSLPIFGAGVTVNSVQVLSLSQLTANVTVDAAAALTTREVSVSTGTEVASGPTSSSNRTDFTVTGAPGFTLNPSSAIQGQQTLSLNLNATFISLVSGDTFINFGAGITASEVPVTVTSGATGSVIINVAPTATTGARTVTLRVGANSYPVQFTVSPSTARLLSVSPASGLQGAVLDVTITGQNTNFAAGQTTVNFGGGISATLLGIDSPTQARARLTIDPAAAVGARSPLLSTGGESAGGTDLFAVIAATPVLLSITPDNARQQETFNATILGQLTNFSNLTTPSLGPDVIVNSFIAHSPTSLTANLTVRPRATLGARTVSVLGVLGALPNAFNITNGPAAISAVSPNSLPQTQSGTVIITGVNTNFAAGLTTASFGPGVSVSSFVVTGATSATALVIVDATATVGPRTVTLTTEGESASLASGFNVTQGVGVIDSVTFTGAAAQGRTFDLTVDGAYLTIDGTTTAVFAPAGITVNSIVNVPQPGASFRAIVNVTVQPTAALGARSLTLTTGITMATRAAALTVVAGPATLSTVTPNRERRGQTVDLVLTGSGTNFSGLTTAAFAPSGGIAIVSLTPASLTQATLRIALDPAAQLGPRTLTLTTGGEVVSTTFTVDAALLDISTLTLPFGTTGLGYSQTVASTGGASPFNFTISAGTLPGGLVLNAASGAITGTPNATGSFPFTVQVTDGSSQTASRALTVAIYDPLTISATPLNPGLVGLSYNETVATAGGASPRTVTLQIGSLPVNLNLNSATGAITGALTTPGTANFTLRVTDNVGQTRDQAFSVVIYPALVFTTSVLPAARTTTAYSQTAAFTGGVPSITVTLATGTLPGGLILNEGTGAIAGTPNATGTFNFELRLTDSRANTALRAFSLDVVPAMTITTLTLPNGVVGRSYSSTVATANGIVPVEFSISAGALPPGLGIQAGTGLISGTPSLTGSFTFTVQARDGQAFTVTREYTVVIAPPPQLTTISPSQGAQSQPVLVVINGVDTNFAAGQTVANFGAGINVLSVTVNSPTQVTVPLLIDPNAAAGARTVTLTTGLEVASRANFFTVIAGLPEITSILPGYAKRSTTANVTVTGLNLLGASFLLRSPDTSFSGTPGTVTIVSNTGTTAVLSLVLGAQEGQFQLAAATPVGPSLATAGSQFVIAPTAGAAVTFASVLNTFYNGTTDPSIPAGRNTATFFASVLNTAFNESSTPSIPAGRNTATFYASVLNTAYNESSTPSIPVGRNTATFYASVLNTFFNTSGAGLFSTAASLPVSVCNRPTGCPAVAPLQFVPALSSSAGSSAAGSSTVKATGLPRVEPVENWQAVVVGQSIRLAAQEAGTGATVDFEVNGVVIAQVTSAPYEYLFTVPAGAAELTFRIVVRSEGDERASRLTRVIVQPDLGTRLSGTIDANVELKLAAGGLQAEFFHFTAPLTKQPDLREAKPSRFGYVTAINQPNPAALFGDDPLGAGLTPDYAVRFTGELWVEQSGPHRFAVSARGGAVLRLTGQAVADTGFTTGVPVSDEATVTLERGWHPVELTYAQGTGAASLQWQWQRPGEAHLSTVSQEFLRTPLAGYHARPDRQGEFAFPGVPTLFDTVWIRAVQGEKVREYPGLQPRTALPVRLSIPQSGDNH